MDRYYYFNKNNKNITHKFIKFPNELMSNSLYKGISCEAKLLYALMLDRTSISLDNGWKDEKDRVYIFFSIQSIMEYFGCSKPKAIKTLKELEEVDLVYKKKQGQGKNDIIYVKKLAGSKLKVEEAKDAQEQQEEQKEVEPKQQRKKKVVFFYSSRSKKFTCRSQKKLSLEVKDFDPNKTEYNHNNFNISDRSIYQDMRKTDTDKNKIEVYETELKKNIEFDLLVNDFGQDTVQPLVNIMLDALMTKKKEFAGINTELFRNRIWKLRMNHIQYAIWGLRNTKAKINNIYAYVAKTLYQAVTTENYYFTTLLNYNKNKGQYVGD